MWKLLIIISQEEIKMENNTQRQELNPTQVYYNLKQRIKEVLKQIWEADERGENFTHLHEELVLLESLLKNK
jgi:hypothetical protein